MLDEDQKNYVCIDDSGNVVAPNEEASMAVAATFGDELTVHDGTDEWYLEGMRECEELRAGLDAFTASYHYLCDGAEHSPVTCHEQDDDDMGCAPVFSREYSDNGGEDEWVFEHIAERRTAKGHQYDEKVYDDDGKLVATKASSYEYLCKWKWYRELTWEPRAVLEEMGLVHYLDEFDRRRQQIMRPMNNRRSRQLFASPGSLESLMGPNFIHRVMSKMNSDGLYVSQYAPVLNQQLESRFIARWHETSGTHCPMILFHGTRMQNLDPIAQQGFKVPSTSGKVQVVNGSVYGVGIYAAKHSIYSTSFTDCDKMFVCLGLVGPQYTTMHDCGDICVFFDEALIIPLWVVRFKSEFTEKAPTRIHLCDLIRGEESTTGTPSSDKAAAHSSRPLTKKMMRQLPRGIKELYKRGAITRKP
jgi:hypothetical protein